MPNEPLVKFADAGAAPILSYNVPEPVSYFGVNIVEIDVPSSHFYTLADTQPDLLPENVTLDRVRQAMLDGFIDKQIFPIDATQLRYYESVPGRVQVLAMRHADTLVAIHSLTVPSYVTPSIDSSGSMTNIAFNQNIEAQFRFALLDLNPVIVLENYKKGLRLKLTRDKWDRLDIEFVSVTPRLALVETYRLSSFPGDYGAGRVVSTFSLLPGEKTRIGIKTYSKTTSTRNEASSVLDSHTQEASDTLEQNIRSERTDKEETKRQDEWHIDASVSANWGFAKAKASAGYAGSANAGREQCAKNIASSVSKSAARASNKRDIQIDQKSQSQVEAGVEQGLDREIQNINAGRTLNFVFRQMNQEFISVLHFVDARVAFMYGDLAESMRIVDLPSLNNLLQTVVCDAPSPGTKDDYRDEMRKIVKTLLENVFDHQDQLRSIVEEAPLGAGPKTYLRIRRDLTSKINAGVSVPGIAMAVTRNVIRTEGLIVEALVGQGTGLDEYSKGLQDEQVRARRLTNAMQAALVERDKLALNLLSSSDTDGAALYAQAYSDTALREKTG